MSNSKVNRFSRISVVVRENREGFEKTPTHKSQAFPVQQEA